MSTQSIDESNNYPLYISKRSFLQYEPGNPANWSAPPDNVYTALDALALGGGGGTTTVITSAPLTGDGTMGTPVTIASAAQNRVLATPNGSSGVPTIRALVAADIPTLNQNTTGTAANITAVSNATLTTLSSLALPLTQTTGTLPVNRGGTGQTTGAAAFNQINPMTTAGDMIYELPANTAARLPVGTDGQVLKVVAGYPAWSTDLASTSTYIYGTGEDGDVVHAVSTTLTRDMFYNNLTLNASVILSTGGFRVFVKETLTLGAASAIINVGADAVGNIIGFGAAAGTCGNGSNGGAAGLINAGGGNGVAITNAVGAVGGTGGVGTGSSGSPGVGGTVTAPIAIDGGSGIMNDPLSAMRCRDLASNFIKGGTGGGGGKGGASGTAGAGGGGGGVVVIIAQNITGAGSIRANGGTGGNAGGASGGGGGGGGGGGVIVRVSSNDTLPLLSYNVDGGPGGIGDGGGIDGNPGSNGSVYFFG